MQDALGLTDAFTNSLVIWYCKEEKFESLRQSIRQLLEEAGGVCAVSDAQWVKY